MAAFTNQAALSYQGGTVLSNVVTGQLVSPLEMSKTAVLDRYRPGSAVSYLISIVNCGSRTFDALTLTDDLGAYTLEGGATVYPLAYEDGSVVYLVNGTRQPEPAVTPGGPLVIRGISVPAGGNATIVYQARVTAAAPLAAGSSIDNRATLTGAGLASPVSAETSVRATEEAALSIVKSLSPATVQENGQIEYRFTIRNAGSRAADASSAVAVTDTFDPILADLQVTLDGAAMARATGYTYDAATGAFATVPGAITVPAAGFTQDPDSGEWSIVPGETLLTVQGTVTA